MQAAWDALERNDFRFAEAAAREALARAPADGEALYLLGSTLLFEGRAAEALGPLTEAARRLTRRGVAYRLGHCHLALGDFKRAEEALRGETRSYPESANAHNTLGVALVNQGRQLEALAAFVAALRADALHAEAANNAGNVLRSLGRNAEALPYLQSAVTAQPGLADAHHNLGLVLHALQRYDEAAAAFRHAVELEPRKPYGLGSLVWAELHACQWDSLAAHADALREQVREGVPQSPFTLLAVSDSPQEQRQCAEQHLRETLAGPFEPLMPAKRYGHSRLRLAYLSADFHQHATAQLTARLFELHDRSRFEVLGISYGPDDGSAARARLRRAFDKFIDVIDMNDAQAAQALRELEVDIAIDLKGLTANARPGILARRPAPVQATYLGYPGTTGAAFIDYVLADETVVPPAEQRFFSEKAVYLPHTYQVNDATVRIAERTPSRKEARLPEDGFVFCCFNNTWKLTPTMFDVWMRLLSSVPRSVLWLLQPGDAARQNLEDAAFARGVEPSRLVFAPRAPHPEHLARHRLADLFLDTLPYNAHTTTSDALWAGLPVLTCRGTTFAGRVAAGLLGAAGLPELVTARLADYEARALELARDRHTLALLRDKLARNRLACPLFDNERACRNIEAAYLRMWENP
ncbi:MAG: tetratricopeptide repeat protein [Burkholderiales bacterium]|jgi:predicted O-linked N-acetylglucosamine transferase (SPINDLY family)|nr:tetratricopeptide repeat protein [Burkholderiales bacterium]